MDIKNVIIIALWILWIFKIKFIFNNYRHCAPTPFSPAQAAARVLQELGHMPPPVKRAVPRVISENKKGP